MFSGLFSKKIDTVARAKELIISSFPELSVGRPSRFFSDLEMALAFAITIRWSAQLHALIEHNVRAADSFVTHYEGTSAVATLYSFIGASEDEDFVADITSLLKERWDATREIKSVLGQHDDPDQANQLVNAVLVLVKRLVQETKAGPRSRIGNFIEQKSSEERYELLVTWFRRLGLKDSALPILVGTYFRDALITRKLVFDPSFWNQVSDLSASVKTSVSYTVDRPSHQIEQMMTRGQAKNS